MTMLIRCIDVETSGLDPAIHGVVEIATVDVTVEPVPDQHPLVTRGEMWSSLVNPGHEIPPGDSAVHDITDEMVKDAPTLFEVMGRVITGPDPDYYCAHNSRFDSRFFDQTILRRPWLDTYRIALWLWPSAPEHKLATLRYWLKLKLDINVFFEDASVTRTVRSHTALFDAYVCAAVLRRAFMSGATMEQMVEVSSQPALLPKFYFGKNAGVPIEKIDGGYLDWIMSQRGMDEDVTHTAFTELQRRRNLERLQSS